jgi:hypothetical protein
MDAIIRKLLKVVSLANRPGTAGEGNAARHTMVHLCARLGREHGHGVAVQVALDAALQGSRWYATCNDAYYEG